MTLLHPWLALGALLAVIPILLHVVARRRYRTVRWAATDLLQRAIARQAARLQRSDRLLLATRIAILVVAPLTLARPMIHSATAIGQPQSAAVIIVDMSGSMRAGTSGLSAMDAAKSRANELLATLPPPSPIGIIGMGDDAVSLTEGLVLDRQRVAVAINQFRATWGGAQLQPALTQAIQWLHDMRVPNKRIYVITDSRENVFTQNAAGTRMLLKQSAIDLELTILPISPAITPNTVITRLEIVRPASPSGAPTTIRAHIATEPNHNLKRTAVELWIDGRKADRRIVDTEKESACIDFQPIVGDVGLHTIEARLDPDGCDIDNQRFAGLYIPQQMNVAIVSSSTDDTQRSARTYLQTALESIADVGPPWSVKPMVPTERIANVLDDRLWLLILADTGPLPADVVEHIGRFIEQGGACWVTGSRTLDETLASFQRSDSPASSWMTILRLGAPPDPPPQTSQPMRIKTDSIDQLNSSLPIDLTANGAQTAFASINLFQVRHVAPATDSPWTIALRTNDNWPLLLTHPNHRLALLTTSLDATATDWPYRPAFVTLIDDLTYWLCKPRLVAAEATVGCKWQPFAPKDISNLTLVTPDSQSLASTASNDLTLNEPGQYRFTDSRPPQDHDARWAVVVNIDPNECRCPAWSPAQIASWLPAGPHRVINPEDKLDFSTTVDAKGMELWPFLAAALLALLILETILGHRFAAPSEADISSEVQV